MNRLPDDYNNAIVVVENGRVRYEGHSDYVLVALKTAREIQADSSNASVLSNFLIILPVLLTVIVVGCAVIGNIQKYPQVYPQNGISTTY